MIVIPAVDVRDGACVPMSGAAPANERLRLPNAVVVARDWADAGFRKLHVVDVDAATGSGNNLQVVEEILRDARVPVQVGGGVRSTEDVEQLFRAGADHVVVGTRAIEDPEWLADLAALYPGVIIVATDVRERRVVTRGWVRTLPHDILDVVDELNPLPLGGILVTALHAEGQMRRSDLSLMEDVAEAAAVPVIASGGISSVEELRALDHRGVAGAVIGVALYTGELDARALAQEFAE